MLESLSQVCGVLPLSRVPYVFSVLFQKSGSIYTESLMPLLKVYLVRVIRFAYLEEGHGRFVNNSK